MSKKINFALISTGVILMLLILFFIIIYIPYINRLTPFETDFIKEIHVTKNGKEIVIIDSDKVNDLRTYFDGYYRCFNQGVNCFGADEIKNYNRYGHPVHPSTNYRFEVLLIGESKTFKLFPADDCGYYTNGPLSFLFNHYYMLVGKVPDMFIQYIETMYNFN
jgi:hypothetical protein